MDLFSDNASFGLHLARTLFMPPLVIVTFAARWRSINFVHPLAHRHTVQSTLYDPSTHAQSQLPFLLLAFIRFVNVTMEDIKPTSAQLRRATRRNWASTTLESTSIATELVKEEVDAPSTPSTPKRVKLELDALGSESRVDSMLYIPAMDSPIHLRPGSAVPKGKSRMVNRETIKRETSST